MKTAQVVLPDGFSFLTEVPETPQERMDGLRNRPNAGNGMLFVFEHSPSITMLGMKFPLDIVAIDQHNMVTGVYERAPVILSRIDAQGQYILELPAGSIQSHGISPGSKIGIAS
jgi:uncharacterized membrane protein (UPF0127 family)